MSKIKRIIKNKWLNIIIKSLILIDKDDVNWRDTNVKRPWLAGLIKQQMCAMLDTLQLTDMLDAGLSSNQR